MSESRAARTARVLEELIESARRCGLEVRREKILREVGYRARGGACRVKQRELVIVDREQSVEEQIEVVADALRERGLESLYLSPAARRMIGSDSESP